MNYHKSYSRNSCSKNSISEIVSKIS